MFKTGFASKISTTFSDIPTVLIVIQNQNTTVKVPVQPTSTKKSPDYLKIRGKGPGAQKLM